MTLSVSTPVIGFAAFSGTGKTTLLKQLIPLLCEQGIRLAIVKHSHHNFEIDHKGKDSYELHHAGSLQTLIASKHRSALITENPSLNEPDLETALQKLDLTHIDLVLVEGFRDEKKLPRIELHRPSLGKPFLHSNDNNIIAIACDQNITTQLPQLNLNQCDEICAFIIQWMKQQSTA